MGIHITNEDVIPLSDVPKELPPLRRGRRVHKSTVYRWTSRGTNGIRLEVAKIGGTLVTSREALQRFVDRLTAKAAGEVPPPDRRTEEVIERELDRHGF